MKAGLSANPTESSEEGYDSKRAFFINDDNDLGTSSGYDLQMKI
jgi:hypothetical protein